MDEQWGKKEESQTIYLISPPSLFLHLYGRTEKCELSIRGRGWGDRERGRVRRWKNTQYGETRGEEESETERKREDRKHRRSVIRG